MRRPRVRLRTLMILVLLACVVAEAYVLGRRSVESYRRSLHAESNEVFYAGLARDSEAAADMFRRTHDKLVRFLEQPGNVDRLAAEPRGSEYSPEDLESLEQDARRDAARRRKLAESYARRKSLYRRVARHPWISVDTDLVEGFWDVLQE